MLCGTQGLRVFARGCQVLEVEVEKWHSKASVFHIQAAGASIRMRLKGMQQPSRKHELGYRIISTPRKQTRERLAGEMPPHRLVGEMQRMLDL